MKYKILIGLRLPLLPVDRLENTKKSLTFQFFFFLNLLDPGMDDVSQKTDIDKNA